MSNKVGIVSLGCDKNRIDTENMMSYLSKDGFEFTQDESEADAIIVNTCAFIESAKQEAIDTVLEMAEHKKDRCKVLAVTGCLPQRYMKELEAGLQEADILLGTCNYAQLSSLLREKLDGKKERIALENLRDSRNFTTERILTTPYHYAYLKVAEGCDNHCTYCAIPSIRGRYTSRPMEELVLESKNLIREYGVQELILVAQDVSRYGIDLYGKFALVDLLKELVQLDVHWIRLLYLYPEQITDELLYFIKENPKICPYLDIPLQHVSNAVLKRMGRKIDQSDIFKLLERIRSICPDIEVRSTFIVGFPGESEQDFAELLQFISHENIDKCGFFMYSKEDGTPAARLGGQIRKNVKEKRQQILYAAQQDVMRKKGAKRVGTRVEVLYEGIDAERGCFVGRTATDAPEIDRLVYFHSAFPVDIGHFYTVEIENTDSLDYIGRTVEEPTA